MAINLFAKYYKQLVDAYTQRSVLKGKASKRFDFTGVKTINIANILTQPLNDYDRTSTGSRYGTLVEVQDEIQEETCTQDRSFKLAVDKGNNSEQEMIKNAGRVLQAQIKEQVVPGIDKYAINKWCHRAGKTVVLSAALSKSNIGEKLIDAETHFANENVPEEGRYVIMGHTKVALLRQMFTDTEKGVGYVYNGWKGLFGTLNVVGVPDVYMPATVAFFAFQSNSVILAEKITEARIITDSENVSGAILLGRYIYDAFVVGHICQGTYLALVNGTARATDPVLTVVGGPTGAGAIAITEANDHAYYTLDGSDPRYSKTKKPITADLANQTWPAGTVVKAVAISNTATVFASDVVTGVSVAAPAEEEG